MKSHHRTLRRSLAALSILALAAIGCETDDNGANDVNGEAEETDAGPDPEDLEHEGLEGTDPVPDEEAEIEDNGLEDTDEDA